MQAVVRGPPSSWVEAALELPELMLKDLRLRLHNAQPFHTGLHLLSNGSQFFSRKILHVLRNEFDAIRTYTQLLIGKAQVHPLIPFSFLGVLLKRNSDQKSILEARFAGRQYGSIRHNGGILMFK